jgi:two-component system chemotaxis response regulator CheY
MKSMPAVQRTDDPKRGGIMKEEGTMSKTILLVDDAAVVRHVVSLTLRKAGYEVIEAINGNDALQKLARNKVQMVITDLNMPEMDGIELIRHLRGKAVYRFMPVIMLTTVSQEERKKEGKLAGASGWIFKPFQSKDLLDTVKRFVA